MNDEIKKLLATGKVILLRENEGFICGGVVKLEEPDSTILSMAIQLDGLDTLQQFAGRTIEEAFADCLEREALPY